MVAASGGVDEMAKAKRAAQAKETDMSALVSAHRFIREPQDDASTSYGARLAKRYYDRLFREYCIADLSQYKASKLGLRWRTQAEVISGKGQFECGVRGCSARDGLASYEVNFAYQEDGRAKQALVKLRCCQPCALKLNYKREKAFRRLQAQQLAERPGASRKRRADAEPDNMGQDNDSGKAAPAACGWAEGEDKDWVAPPPGSARALAGSGSGGSGAASPGMQAQQAQVIAGVGSGVQQPSVLSGDPSVWEIKPVQEGNNAEEELDQYLSGMFF